MRRAVIVGAALVLDVVLGQPRRHPVAGIGSLLGATRDRRRARSAIGALVEGGLAVGGVAVGVAALARALARVVDGDGRSRPAVPSALTESLLLHPALALDALLEAGRGVVAALREGHLDEARRRLAWDLVSRDTSELSPSLVASGAIESMGENLSDSVIAPVCAYLTAGLPGAWAYRVVNTADAMVGYRTTAFEWYGKVAARTDDLLNLGPARLTAMLLRVASPDPGAPRWAQLPGQARRAAGPNAGWPMAALALALDVRLEKPGTYILNPAGRPPESQDIDSAAALVRRAAWLGAGALFGGAALRATAARIRRQTREAAR